MLSEKFGSKNVVYIFCRIIIGGLKKVVFFSKGLGGLFSFFFKHQILLNLVKLAWSFLHPCQPQPLVIDQAEKDKKIFFDESSK